MQFGKQKTNAHFTPRGDHRAVPSGISDFCFLTSVFLLLTSKLLPLTSCPRLLASAGAKSHKNLYH